MRIPCSVHTAKQGSDDLLGIGVRRHSQVEDGTVPVDEIALHYALNAVGIALRQCAIGSERFGISLPTRRDSMKLWVIGQQSWSTYDLDITRQVQHPR